MKILWNGILEDGIDIAFEGNGIFINNILLKDDSTLIVNYVITNVVKLLTKTDMDGNPIYAVKANVVIAHHPFQKSPLKDQEIIQ